MFIVLEGLDASGKSTQAKILCDHFGAVCFKYPDRTTPIGRILNRWLRGEVTLAKRYVTAGVGVDEDEDAALTLQALMLANKVEVQDKLLTALHENHGWVIADRYSPSARAYGVADGLSDEWLEESHRTLIEPDLYVLIDVTVAEALRRKGGVAEHYETNLDRLERARKKYLHMTQYERGKHQWEVVNGMKPVEEVTKSVIRAVERHRKPHHNGG